MMNTRVHKATESQQKKQHLVRIMLAVPMGEPRRDPLCWCPWPLEDAAAAGGDPLARCCFQLPPGSQQTSAAGQ